MDDDISMRIREVEEKVKTKCNCVYKNAAYDLAMSKKHRICIYYDGGFMAEKHPIVKLEDMNGQVLGTSLLPEEIESYKGREDVLWVSDDFVVFPYLNGEIDEAFILYPFDIPEIRDNVPDCEDLCGTSPTLASDALLKDWGSIDSSKSVFTAIVAFD